MIKFIIYICFFLSGITGLIYQIVWSKYFILFIGATTYAHAITLSMFMGGLAFGNYIFGHLADRGISKLKLYAALEVGIGLTCLLFPALFGFFSQAYLYISQGVMPNSPANLLFKVLLCAASMLLPTTLMGGTIPAMSKFLIRRLGEVGARVGLLYFFNTAGAAIGCILGGFFVIHTLGLEFSIQSTATVNLLIGITFLYLSKYEEGGAAVAEQPRLAAPQKPDAPYEVYPDTKRKIAIFSIALSGVTSMLYELVWTRLLSLYIGSATQSFSIMLLTFITGIAVGSFIASKLLERNFNAGRLFALVEMLIFTSLFLLFLYYERLPYYFHVLGGILPRRDEFFAFYELSKVLICFLAMFLPTIFIGMSLPAASRLNVRGMNEIGKGVGNTFSFNTTGNLIGSALTGFVLIPALGLERTLEIGMIMNFIIGAVLLFVFCADWKRLSYAAATAGVLLSIFLVVTENLDKTRLQGGMYRRRWMEVRNYEDFKNIFRYTELLYYKDGSSVTVSVMKTKDGHFSLRVNGKPEASTRLDMTTQLWVGHIAPFLHKNPESAYVIGLGSGVTAHAVSLHKEIKSVEVAEISAEVIGALYLFAPYNDNIQENPKVRILNVDGREYLKLNSGKKYDIIVSEPSNPWMAGIGNLFTKQFFEEAKSHLNAGGIMVQWVQVYEISDRVLSIILNTFGSVFNHVTVWSVIGSNDIFLVGSESPITVDLDRIAAKFDDQEIKKSLVEHAEVKIADPLSFLSMQIISEAKFKATFSSNNPRLINEDNFPIVEYEAPKAFFVGKKAKILLKLDERLSRPASSLLFVKELLAKKPLTVEEAQKLLSIFTATPVESDWNVIISLTHYLYDTGGIAAIKQFAKFLDTGLIGAGTLLDEIARSDDISKEDCASFLQTFAKTFSRKLSVFYVPDTSKAEEIFDICVKKHPEGADVFREAMASVLK